MLTNFLAPYGSYTSYIKNDTAWGLSDPKTPQQILFEALNENPHATLPSLVLNPAIPHEIVWHILNNHSQSAISDLSLNPNLNPEMIKKLWELRGDELRVQRNIINLPQVTTGILEYLIKTFPGSIDMSFSIIFSRPDAPIYLLFYLAFANTYENLNTLTFRQKIARKKIEELGVNMVKRDFLKHYGMEDLVGSVEMIPVDWFAELSKQLY